MFEINPEAIGVYISDLIDESPNFVSSRDFCREWLKLELNTNKEPDGDSLQNRANKLSQIKKGKKNIQIDDLPIFSKLLGVSFERILSAGESGPALPKRVSNYYIAQSKSKKEWQEYIDRADKPFLYMDEFGKTIIEYAIEFQNYAFIKFLMDKHCMREKTTTHIIAAMHQRVNAFRQVSYEKVKNAALKRCIFLLDPIR